MTHWRIAVKTLYDLGGTAETNDLALAGANQRNGLREARQLGLVEHNGRHNRQSCVWQLTDKGIAVAEGRLMSWRGAHPTDRAYCGDTKRPHAHIRTWFIATWLSALPRDVRISSEAPQ